MQHEVLQDKQFVQLVNTTQTSICNTTGQLMSVNDINLLKKTARKIKNEMH